MQRVESRATIHIGNLKPDENDEGTPLLLQEKLLEETPEFPDWHNVSICAFTYFLGSLFVYSPLYHLLGDIPAKHMIATTSVWIYPIRTLGNMIEVIYYVLMLVLLSSIEIVLSTSLISFLKYLDPEFSHGPMVMLGCLAAVYGFLGYLKVRIDKLSFNTAATMNIIYIAMLLVREDCSLQGELPTTDLLRYVQMIITGVFITGMVSFLVYHKTARSLVDHEANKLQRSYMDMVNCMVSGFGTRHYPTNDSVTTSNLVLSDMKVNLKYSRYEANVLKFFNCDHYRYDKTDAKMNSLQRQSMFASGMHHCVKSVYALKSKSSNKALITDLKEPMVKLVNKLTHYVQDPEDEVAQFEASVGLGEYVHERDEILNKTFDYSGKKSEDDSLLAIIVLFLFLLEKLARQVVDDNLKPSSMSSSATSHHHFHDVLAPLPKYFAQLHKAMHPSMKSEHEGFGPRLWRVFRVFKSRDVRHGLRVAFGVIILAFPAYNARMRPYFMAWHCEWAVITYMIIMARNLGAMTDQIPLRVFGTLLGAIIGVSVALFCKGNGIFMCICSIFVSWFCFRRILSKTKPVFGRFVMLTYNIVCLYGYSLSRDENMGSNVISLGRMYEIAFHRCVGVIIGVFWAVFITLTVWPYSARQALRANLCIQWMRMGMVWKSDILSVVSVANPAGGKVCRFRGISIERELQNMMLYLDGLLKNSPKQFRLRGKFEKKPYKRLLASTQLILDALHSVSILIENEPDVNFNERALVVHTAPERYLLSNALFLQFYTASTSVRLGFPVPEYLAKPTSTIEKLVDKLKAHRMQLCSDRQSVNPVQANYDFVLFYSYLMLAITISSELQNVLEALRTLFGTLDDEVLFEYV